VLWLFELYFEYGTIAAAVIARSQTAGEWVSAPTPPVNGIKVAQMQTAGLLIVEEQGDKQVCKLSQKSIEMLCEQLPSQRPA